MWVNRVCWALSSLRRKSVARQNNLLKSQPPSAYQTQPKRARFSGNGDNVSVSLAGGRTLQETIQEIIQCVDKNDVRGTQRYINGFFKEILKRINESLNSGDVTTDFERRLSAWTALLQASQTNLKNALEQMIYLEEFRRINLNSFGHGVSQIAGVRIDDVEQARDFGEVTGFLSQLNALAENVHEFLPNGGEIDPTQQTQFLEKLEAFENEFPVLKDGDVDSWTKDGIIDNFQKRIMQSFAKSPLMSAASRVFSDILSRYPHLRHKDLTVEVMITQKTNSLYTQFQRLVGIDWALGRRTSGVRVTYASDYNRLANQYRTTLFCFETARIVRQPGNGSPATGSTVCLANEDGVAPDDGRYCHLAIPSFTECNFATGNECANLACGPTQQFEMFWGLLTEGRNEGPEIETDEASVNMNN